MAVACNYFPTFLPLSTDKIFFSNQFSQQNMCIYHQTCRKQCCSRFLATASKKSRKDLAHIIRLRGYKLIRQFLEFSTTTNLIKSDTEMDETGKLKMLQGSEGQNEKLKALASDELSRGSTEEGDLYRYQEKDRALSLSGQMSLASESSNPFMQEKVANFIKHGKLIGIDG